MTKGITNERQHKRHDVVNSYYHHRSNSILDDMGCILMYEKSWIWASLLMYACILVFLQILNGCFSMKDSPRYQHHTPYKSSFMLELSNKSQDEGSYTLSNKSSFLLNKSLKDMNETATGNLAGY